MGMCCSGLSTLLTRIQGRPKATMNTCMESEFRGLRAQKALECLELAKLVT